MIGIGNEERKQLGKLFPIEIVPYNSNWPTLYQEEVRFLSERLQEDTIIRIEHYGSTAVPGLAAKDCIDILLEIISFDCAEKKVVPILNECLGYGHAWYKDHLVFF